MAESNFVDYVKICCRSGKGGRGSMHMHRAKYIPNGGPDGGDGGRGGHVYLRGNHNYWTLLHLRYERHVFAGHGGNGGQSRSTGAKGEDRYIDVPCGTVAYNAETGEYLCDVTEDGQVVMLLRGGRGGLGNWNFRTSTNQAPRFAQPGEPMQEMTVVLELKLLADVGLVGFPNVGKSTLLSVVSKAHPKIANYHFTTLYPNLGVVYVDEGVSFVMADIPGIIEGASEGAGLGHDFLRHIDRCRLLVHLVDVSGSEGRDPVEDFDAINAELREYSPELAERPQIVVGNKCDLLGDERENIDRLREHVEELGYQFFEMSAVSHQGTRELVKECAHRLSELPPISSYEADYVKPEPKVDTSGELTIEKFDDMWLVEGPWLQRLVATVNFGDYESRMYFDRVLREAGVFKRMEEMGVRDGDTVSMYDLMFEYQD